jgi:hypothetical protein
MINAMLLVDEGPWPPDRPIPVSPNPESGATKSSKKQDGSSSLRVA